jgi:alanyl-tRNA synthetase
LTRDVAREQGLEVDETGFREAMSEHRLVSGAGKAFGSMGGEDVDVYRGIMHELVEEGALKSSGVDYNPYEDLELDTNLLSMVKDGEPVSQAEVGDKVEVVLPRTCFYAEAGGQVSDTGKIYSTGTEAWEIRVDDVRKPAAGIMVHIGQVVQGQPKVGDSVIAAVDGPRRKDIMRNHTATHLLHAELQSILGQHARQAGSLVAPDRLRFDFTHPEAVTPEQLEQIEAGVNQAILENHRLKIAQKSLDEAMAEGAMALFGEKYGSMVRTISIGGADPFSYELCGGTHVDETGDIGTFLITSESSAAAGVRRIEAITGRAAYELIQKRTQVLKQAAHLLETVPDEVPGRIRALKDELDRAHKQNAKLRQGSAEEEFRRQLGEAAMVNGAAVLSLLVPDADADTMRQLTDHFRQQYPSGVVVLGSAPEGRPTIIAAVTEDLVKRGLHAGDLVKTVAQQIGGGGGGRPTLAQAGGKDAEKLPEALSQVEAYVRGKLQA